jgi:hypothetical protein
MTQSYLTLTVDDVILLQALLHAETKGFVRAIVDRGASSKKKSDEIMALISGHSQYETLIDAALHGAQAEREQLDFLYCLVEYADPKALPKDMRSTFNAGRNPLLAKLQAARTAVPQLAGWSAPVAQA